jgi:hypothetical protein
MSFFMGAKLPRFRPDRTVPRVGLSELSDRRLAWQPGIYQRYSFLARLTDILTGDVSGALAYPLRSNARSARAFVPPYDLASQPRDGIESWNMRDAANIPR